jgi:L-lysine 6-transaminase
VPAITHPLSDHLGEVIAAEEHALQQAERAFTENPHDIAAFIAEPIQGEGGDNHMRPEFLQAMLELVHANDALFIVDEVQTGVGTTGTAWAYQQLGIQPTSSHFRRRRRLRHHGRRPVDEVPDNVFTVSGRINSTWGGGLVDMVRSRRSLEIIESADLIEQAGPKGQRLVAGLEMLRDESGLISNVRGRGLFVAFDPREAARARTMPSTTRETVEHVIVLAVRRASRSASTVRLWGWGR